MTKTHWLKLLALLCVFSFVAAACGDDDDDTGDATDETTTAAPAETDPPEETTTAPPAEDGGDDAATTTTAAPDDEPAALELWDDGPCDESLDTVKVGLITSFATGALSLEDQAIALEAATPAFNARGGVNGACIEALTCDDEGDPNQAVQCAQDLVDQGIVATINDTTSTNALGVIEVFQEAGIARFALSPGTDELGDSLTFGIDAGGIGTTIMMVPALLAEGHTQIATIRVDIAAAAVIPALLNGIFADEGVEFVADLPVPAGTTDYSQFVLAAEEAGATGVIMPLDGPNAVQVMAAAAQLDSDLVFSASLGTFGRSDITDIGDYASHMRFNAAVPPATFDTPALGQIAADLEANSDDERLQRNNLKASPMRSWIGLYAFIYMLREAQLSEITAATVLEATEAVQSIPMLGLIPDWTPGTNADTAFVSVSQPVYRFWSWDGAEEFDGEAGNFVQIGEGDFNEVIETSSFSEAPS